jgi:8-oxo-dGTP pyrophosphatase MutT (NUDIX family)
MEVINGLIFEGNKVLVVKKKETYILPGGKIEKNESIESCLKREFFEELNGTKIICGHYYNSFSGITPHSKKPFDSKVYYCELSGKLGKPSLEILDRIYVGREDFNKYNFSNVTKEILKNLSLEGLL